MLAASARLQSKSSRFSRSTPRMWKPSPAGHRCSSTKSHRRLKCLNDLDGEIVNFFRVCQQHYEELVRYLRFMVVSRKWHELLKATDPATLTDIQRAARHLYLLKNSYASLVRSSTTSAMSFSLRVQSRTTAGDHRRNSQAARARADRMPPVRESPRAFRPARRHSSTSILRITPARSTATT